MSRVEFNLPPFYLQKILGRKDLPENCSDQVEQMYLNLFNTETAELDESRLMDVYSQEQARLANAYHEVNFRIKHYFLCSLRIMRGKVGKLVVALAIKYFHREVVIEVGEKFLELFIEPLNRVGVLYGERLLFDHIDMRIVKDTYDNRWMVLKQESYWNAAELSNERKGCSVVFSERLWNLFSTCLRLRVKPAFADVKHMCNALNAILGQLKVRARSLIKAKCSACQRPESGCRFSCMYTNGDTIRKIFAEITATERIAAPGSVLNDLWTKIDKMYPEIEQELREEMTSEETLIMKYHTAVPGFLRAYVAPLDDTLDPEVEELFNDM